QHRGIVSRHFLPDSRDRSVVRSMSTYASSSAHGAKVFAPGRFVTASLPDRISDKSPQVSGEVLKRFLSIFSDRIFDSSVDRGMPNLAAAPVGPDIRPRLSFSPASIISFSCAKSLPGSSIWFFGSVRDGCFGNQL